MRRVLLVATMTVLAVVGKAAGEELPPLSKFLKPKETEEKKQEEAKPAFPPRLSLEEARLPVEAALPPKPLFFFEIVDRPVLEERWALTAAGAFLQSEPMAAFWNQNTQTMGNLFSAIPKAQENAGTVNQFTMLWRVAGAVFPHAKRVALAGYGQNTDAPTFALLFELGRDRADAFHAAEGELEKILKEYTDLTPTLSPREGDYLDVIRSERFPGMELTAGMVRNFYILTTRQETGQAIRDRIQAGESAGGLVESSEYRQMLGRADSEAQARGFVDMKALLASMQALDLAGATEMIDFACDVAGRGILYYDYRCDGRQIVEHVSSPALTSGEQATGIQAQLARLAAPAQDGSAWIARIAKGLPYEAEFAVGVCSRPDRLAKLLEESQPLGNSDYAVQIGLSIPEVVRDLIVRQLKSVLAKSLTGEAALALLAQRDEKTPWVILFGLSDSDQLEKLLGQTDPASTVAGVKIWQNGTAEAAGQAWGVLTPKLFPKLPVPYLAITSDMPVFQSLIDHATLGASLADQEDFAERIAGLPQDVSAVWYDNLGQTLGANYRAAIMDLVQETFPPHARSIAGLPQASLLRSHLFGLCGGVTVQTGGAVCRSTITTPMGIAPAMTGMLVLHLPSWMRHRSRIYMSQSRANLGKMWLKLQSHATRSGKFPSGSDQGIEPVRQLFTPEERDRVFYNAAAAEELGTEAARTQAYRYVGGLRTMDEPDFPLVYESAPWHFEFDGIIRPSGNDMPRESGEYQRWRLVLTLDGTIAAYTETEFVRDVLPRIQARQ